MSNERRIRNKKQYKSPADLRRDHRNFTSHLAGNKTIEFENFDNDSLGEYDTAIESNDANHLLIKRPKGRQTFDANLLTAGQVKFANHDLSFKVRANMTKKLAETTEEFVHDTAALHYYHQFSQATRIYDSVYNILENFRASRQSAKHFNRPKILKSHLDEVKYSTQYGYDVDIIYEEKMMGATELRKYRQNNNNQDPPNMPDIKRPWYSHDQLSFKIDFVELRKYIYGFVERGDIQNKLVKNIANRHHDLLQIAKTSSNPVSPVHAALTIALDFEMTAQEAFGNEPYNRLQTETMKPSEDSDHAQNQNIDTETVPNSDLDNIESAAQEIITKGLDDYQEFLNKKSSKNSLQQVSIDKNIPESFDEARKLLEDSITVEKYNSDCSGSIQEPYGATYTMSTNIDLSNITLDEELDHNNKTIGSRGYRLTRNAWKLPAFSDVNVFRKHPPTSADLITLIDGSGSMGSINSHGYRNSPLQQSADLISAVRKRFPESKAFTFSDLDQDNPMYATYQTKHENHYYDAGLYEIIGNQFPINTGGSTPLCGALKTLEQNFSLDHARLIIVTDGDANSCITRDPLGCVNSILEAWRNKGIRVATVFTPNYIQHTMPKSLHGDITVRTKPQEPLTVDVINQMFTFIKG